MRFGQNNGVSFLQKFAMWMQGRNGPDQLYKFLLYLSLLILILNAFLRSWIIELILLLVIAFMVFRMFSKNVAKRRKENQIYLNVKTSVIRFFRRIRSRIVNRKTNVYRKCPQCKTVLCMPRKKGKHQVSCPRCHHHFEVKI